LVDGHFGAGEGGMDGESDGLDGEEGSREGMAED